MGRFKPEGAAAQRAVTADTLSKSQVYFSFALVSSLFFVWGLSYGLLDSLNKTFQDSLHLTKAQSTGLQACYFGAYLINGPISGPLAARYGYRFSIHGGLGLFSLGAIMFWPCAKTYSYPGFLACTFVTASGLAWLEMAANSYITVLGPPENAAFRLVFAQCWNGVASVLGPIIAGRTFLKTGYSHTLNHLQWVYLGISAFGCIINLLFFIAKLPEVKQEVASAIEHKPVSIWTQPHLIFGAIAEFFYVGSQVAVASLTINYYVEQPGLNITVTRAADLFSVTLAVFTIARFMGVPVLAKVDAALVLGICGIGCIVTSILTAVVPGAGGIACLMLIFFFESVCYPIIFTLATSNLGANQKLGSALVAAGVSGGAWMPSVQAVVADAKSTQTSFFVPISGFAVVAAYGFYMHMRGCKQQGYWSWRKLDKETTMNLTAAAHHDVEHSTDDVAGSDKDIKVGQSSPTYPVVSYQH
ncbi:Major facilitator superfamily [Kalmanozyma brasiliensis GHG001]|uniref:Glucose/galactose transporter n=1 Tax=Kalmanozyma brasiliensis (strain GHG001) TaxID=1365824 RepID=V5F1H5_KALBG|nr:Major facilitator superfamily [Kalmanozyma brasiliensis GHG001]EST09144.1 Major facilitator superfamily [Kalmanozyma brasiliensis GHG001]